MAQRVALIFAAGALAILSQAAHAQDYQVQWERCGLDPKRRLPPGPDAIEGCTAVLQAGRETPRVLAQALVNRGDSYRMRDRAIDRALDDYSQAIRLQPDFALAFANRGFTYLFEKQDHERAIKDFDEALRLDPQFASVFYYRAVARSDKGEFRRAIGDFDQAIRLKPNFAVAWRDRGQAKIALGDQAGGKADIAEAERVARLGLDCMGTAGCVR